MKLLTIMLHFIVAYKTKRRNKTMVLNIEEKKVLYAFGCSSLKNTIIRLKYLTAITVAPDVKHMIMVLSEKVGEWTDDEEYFNYYYQLRREMDTYFKARQKVDEIEKNSLRKEENTYDETD